MNSTYVLVNAIGRWLRRPSMVAHTSDRPTAQRDQSTAEIRRYRVTCEPPHGPRSEKGL